MLRIAFFLLALLPFAASATTTLKISTLYPDGTALVNGLKEAAKPLSSKPKGG